MDFGDFEDEIKTVLETNISITGVEFQVMPDSEAEFQLPFEVSKVTVAFADEEPEPASKSSFIVAQEVTRTFTILMQARSLRQPSGIYPVAQKIKQFLKGFRPSFGDKFTYAGFKFQTRENGFFEYTLSFKTKGYEIEESDNIETPLGANLTDVKYK